jgi:predicted short-subunit dehydrogenase-like oxidoreductase (DUF2520 family)
MSATSRAHHRRATATHAADPPTLTRSFTIGIIGTGRVGTILGSALHRAGHRVVATSGSSSGGSPASRARRRRLLPGVPVRDLDQVTPGVDLVLLSVPDDVLAGLVAELVQAGAIRAGQVVLHTSGAYGIGVLAPAAAVGAHVLAVHPAMTFTGERTDLARLSGISYGVTAAPALRPLATRLVADLGGSPEWVDEADRPLYHAALAHGANHLVTLVNESMDLLRASGVHHPDRVLGPLLRAALENALRYGDAALTGPVSRGDAGTVARHLDVLRRHAPDSMATYLALARRTADRAIATGQLRPTDAAPLLGVLARRATELPG